MSSVKEDNIDDMVRFILKSLHFLLRNPDFLLKNVDFIISFKHRMRSWKTMDSRSSHECR